MDQHSCESIIVTCIDFRFQDYINNWIKQNLAPKTYDRVALAGGVKNLEMVLNQIQISHRLHHIKKVFLINHEDCGAYGQEGTPEKHTEDLKLAAQRINEQHPDIKVDSYYLHLDGNFEKIN